MSVLVNAAAALALAAAGLAQGLRWWRVLQREHYHPGAVLLFWRRWIERPWRVRAAPSKVSWVLAAVSAALIAVALSTSFWFVGVAAVTVLGLVWPRGLSIKGRTSTLAWTRRLKTVAGATLVLTIIVLVIGVVTGGAWFAAVSLVLGAPLLIDASARVTAPLERRLAQRFVDEAAARLAKVSPLVIGITGSYGKTSTKQHLAELLGGYVGVVPTPRSFNNRAGLSRAINENLVDGTKVFIAEMGTYGPGEIADLCAWCPPRIAVITAIGPVHLERMNSLDTIERAKYEITSTADTVIVNVDDDRLVAWPDRLRAEGKRVVTAGSAREGDVTVREVGERWRVTVDGVEQGVIVPVAGVRPTNLACALAAALAVGRSIDELLERCARLGAVPNRLQSATAPSGVVVIDDTFNANPASARSAVAFAAGLPTAGRRVLVTPGLIELGSTQAKENADLAAFARAAGLELVTVNRTNAASLLAGYGADALSVDTRQQAVAWVRASLHATDVVLYVNDLPDHYP